MKSRRKRKMNEDIEDGMISNSTNKILKSRDMAKEFVKKQPTYYDEGNKWWGWSDNKKCWQMIDETELFIRFDKTFPKKTFFSLDPRIKTIIKDSLKRVARENKPEKMKKTFIQFNDTILDLESMDEFEATPKYFITNPIPWTLGKDDKTPVMDRIFEEWVGEDKVQLLHQIIAYCLLPDYPLSRIFCLVGEGSNGKSKFLRLLTNFIGDSNVVTTELDLLLSSNFEKAKLFKKLVCIMGETDTTSIKRTSVLKQLSGGDLIGFELKYKDLFDDYNYAKIVIASNQLPRTDDRSRGFYRRWMRVDFPYEFTEKKDILKEIPLKEYDALARKSVNVLRDLLDKMEFFDEGSIEDRERRYEESSNPFGIFLDKYCDFSKQYYEPFNVFYECLKKYLAEDKRRDLSPKVVGRILGSYGYDRENKYFPETKKNKNVIWGLRLKE
jgi:P4 family phage/plasmid primase-like protien